MSTQWNQQLTRNVFSKVMEYFEQNVQKKSITKGHRIQTK